MSSILIRFTDHKYIDSYRAGELYLSSLSSFWDMRKNKIPYKRAAVATAEELCKAANDLQQDFSEGVSAQISKDVAKEIFPEDMYGTLLYDIRFQVEAYGFCNLLCFYRVDTESFWEKAVVDERFIKNVRKNPLLNPAACHVVQCPPDSMFEFGDTVIIIKDEEEFSRRVIEAVRRREEHCVVGDVRYHRIMDRRDPSAGRRHHVTFRSEQAFLKLADITRGRTDVIRYGSLDKYDRYREQREWRVCWLPQIHNYEGKILSVGDLTDIIEIVDAGSLREWLLEHYAGYYLGETTITRKRVNGTVAYSEFKKIVEQIDGMCRPIFEIG